MDNKFRVLLSDIAIFAIGSLLVKVIQFFLLPLYTIYMTTEEYGIAELTNNFSDFLFPIFSICIYEATFRFCVDSEDEEIRILNNSFAVMTVSSIIISIISCFVNFVYEFKYLDMLLALTISSGYKMNILGYARGIGKRREYVLGSLAGVCSLLLLNVILFTIINNRIWSYLTSLIGSNVIVIALLTIRLNILRYIKLFSFEHHLLKKMVLYSIPMIFNTICWWGITMSNRYLVLYFTSAMEAGLFAAVSKLPAAINIATGVFQQAWQFSASKQYGKSDSVDFYSKVFKFYSALIMIFGSFVLCISNILSEQMLRGDFGIAKQYLPLMLLTAILNGYSVYFGTIYVALKKNKMIMISTILGALINIISSYCLIGSYGIWACVFGSALCYVLIVGIRMFDTYRYVKIDIDSVVTFSAFTILCFQAFLMTTSQRIIEFRVFSLFLVLVSLYIFKYRTILKQVSILRRK